MTPTPATERVTMATPPSRTAWIDMARGMAEVSASSLDSQFDALKDTSADLEVESRLAALKSGTPPATNS